MLNGGDETYVSDPLHQDEGLRVRDKSSAEPARKVMYYAAGSGIPEIKTILSGASDRYEQPNHLLTFQKALSSMAILADGLS